MNLAVNTIPKATQRLINYLIKKVGLMLALMTFSAVVFAQSFTVNFKDADIQELIKFVADSTGRTIVVDPKVKGKVKVVSSRPVSESELYDLFLSVLEINGFTAVDAGGVIRIVPAREARTQPVPVSSSTTGSKRSSKSHASGYRTQVIQVKNVEASKLIPVLRPLVPPEAHLAAYADSNVIVVTDTSQNIARIKKVIERLDSASSEETEVIRLHNASATEAVKALEQLQKQQLGGSKKGSAASRSLQNQAQMVADARTNSILVTGPEVARARIRALAARIDRPVEHLGNARVIRLKHATAKDLAKVLESIAKANNVKDARKTAIQADEASNSLIITGSADMLQTLEGVVTRLDIARPQVLIEAIIVEISDNDSKRLGVQWLYADEDQGFGTSGNAGTAAQVLAGAAQENVDDRFTAIGQALGGLANPAFGIGKLNINGGTSFAALLDAFQGNSQTNILSTPSLMTLDNKEASISIGDEISFRTGSYTSTGNNSSNPGNPFSTFSRETVGLTLKVTPRINEGGSIQLDLDQEVSSLSPTVDVNDQPVTSERKIKTTVSTYDGEIVVIGGLIRDETTQSENKVPLLGDIPILGNVFKNRSTGLTKTHLMIFIRPTVLNSPDRMQRVTRSRYGDIRGKQQFEREKGVNLYGGGKQPPVLAPWEQQQRQLEQIQREKSKSLIKPKKKVKVRKVKKKKYVIKRSKPVTQTAPVRVPVSPPQEYTPVNDKPIFIETTPSRDVIREEQEALENLYREVEY